MDLVKQFNFNDIDYTHPKHTIITAKTMSGKSYLIQKLIFKKIKEFDFIYIISNENVIKEYKQNLTVKDLKNDFKKITYIPINFLLDYDKKEQFSDVVIRKIIKPYIICNNKKKLLIFDDCIENLPIKDYRLINHLIETIRHNETSLILVFHTINKDLNTTIKNNAHFIITMNTVDRTQISNIKSLIRDSLKNHLIKKNIKIKDYFAVKTKDDLKDKIDDFVNFLLNKFIFGKYTYLVFDMDNQMILYGTKQITNT